MNRYLVLVAALSFTTACSNSTDGGGDCSSSSAIAPPGCGTCRSDDECSERELDGRRASSDLACYVPGASRQPACGAQCLPMRDCESAAECGADEVCVEHQERCCSGPSSRCETSCDVTGCSADWRCNSAGRCERIPCDEPGGICPNNHLCEGSTCVHEACADDSECTTGPYCVRGLCENQLGDCLVRAAP